MPVDSDVSSGIIWKSVDEFTIFQTKVKKMKKIKICKNFKRQCISLKIRRFFNQWYGKIIIYAVDDDCFVCLNRCA